MPDRLDWWIDLTFKTCDFIVDNWKSLLALAVAFGLGAGTTAVISDPSPEPVVCEECPPCTTPGVRDTTCIIKVERCLQMMWDTPLEE